MINLFSVFTSGGLVLSQKQEDVVPESVINGLISSVFIENVQPTGISFQRDGFTVKYTVANDLGVVFIVVYKSILQLRYVDEFLTDAKKIFIALFDEQVKNGINLRDCEFAKFDDLINVRLAEVEQGDIITDTVTQQPAEDEEETASFSEGITPSETPERPSTPGTPDSTRRRRRNKKPTVEDKKLKTTGKKKMRRWDDDGMAYDDDQQIVLDYSTTDKIDTVDNNRAEVGDLADYGSATKSGEFVLKELSNELRDILNNTGDGPEETAQPKAFGFLRNFMGGKTLDPDNLAKALAAMEDHLMKKNVAKEVAAHLCDTVNKSLVGSKTQSWTSVEFTVRASMTEALRRILTPNTSLDLLHEVQAKRKTSDRPYVISVVGVNGVGKSTNLSKIGFWLLQNKYKVLIAACDTFRSGAVEQLKVHVRRLQELTARLGTGEVQIFDEGYGKDAAVIAQRAIEYGQKNGFDVVLIDTAGRRHNDDRLMSSLEKFGKLANPDKIIMVGEALVGTDSVQQARNFNAAFGSNRNLDFFLISKCDTVGDMIGTMVNMTYSTGIPVLFVGIGQNYTDLRTLSVEWAVNLLMS
jgi:signal recognition particle receptor subunit alpha